MKESIANIKIGSKPKFQRMNMKLLSTYNIRDPSASLENENDGEIVAGKSLDSHSMIHANCFTGSLALGQTTDYKVPNWQSGSPDLVESLMGFVQSGRGESVGQDNVGHGR